MSTVSSLTVRIGADITELQSAMKRVSSSVQDAGRRMTSLGSTISTRVTAPLTALAAVSVRAFGEQEKAELRLRAALQANGRQVDQLFNKYNKFASQMQAITVVGDETTLAMLAQAESLGLTGDAAERAVRNSIAMQSAFGVNAESALRYTAALEQGNATMLTRYIPTLRDIEDESERAAEAQRVLGRAFSAAEAEGQSVAGMFVRLKNAVGDALEDIGEAVSEAFNFSEVIPPAIEYVNKLRDQFQSLSAETRRRIVLITAAIAGIGPALVAVGVTVTSLGIVIGALTSPVFLVIAAITGIVGAFEYVRRNADIFSNRMKMVFVDLKNFFIRQIADMVASQLEFTRFLPGVTHAAVVQAQASILSLQDPLPELEGNFQSFGEFVKDIGSDVVRTLENITGMDLSFSMPEMDDSTGETPISAAVNKTERSVTSLTGALDILDMDFEAFTVKTEDAFEELTISAESFGDTLADAFGRAIFQGRNLLDVAKQLTMQFAQRRFIQGLSALFTGGASAGIGGVLGSVFGVNDAMITSRGDVVKFHPDDNILAMKDFSNMGGGASAGDMERAFSTALGKFASRLGPDEVWVLNQRGAQLRGRLG